MWLALAMPEMNRNECSPAVAPSMAIHRRDRERRPMCMAVTMAVTDG